MNEPPITLDDNQTPPHILSSSFHKDERKNLHREKKDANLPAPTPQQSISSF